MIRVMPYDRRPNRNELIKEYLVLLNKAFPFFKRDMYILAVNRFHLQEDIAHSIFIQGLSETKESRRAIEAERTVQKYGGSLYKFLYEGKEGTGHIRISRLYKLLTVPMIEEVWQARGMTFTEEKRENGADSVLLKNVFRYQSISRDKQMYLFTEQMHTEVCPYCNRIFTATILNDKEQVIRPQIDHFKSKAQYPFFALSIMNWIPACGFCNHRKSDRENKILYPYVEEVGENYTFRTYYSGTSGYANYVIGEEGAERDFVIRGEFDESLPDELAYKDRIQYILDAKGVDFLTEDELYMQRKTYAERLRNSARIFSWEAASQHHKTYVLRLFRRNYQFGKEYGASLGRSFRNLFMDPTLLYLRDIRKEHWGETPLAKLTHDIDKEIENYNM